MNLTAADWVEIYYALDTKIDTVKTWESDTIERKRWLRHLKNIMTKIGQDGQNMGGKIIMDYQTHCGRCAASLVGERAPSVAMAISTSSDAVGHKAIRTLRNKKKEYLVALFLDARGKIICHEIISIGTLTASLAHPREIFAPAIGKAAASLILAHNHPSGDPSPSDEDIRLTKRIAQAGQMMGIELLDHLIIAKCGVYSFRTAGQL